MFTELMVPAVRLKLLLPVDSTLAPSLGVHVYPTTQQRGQSNVTCNSVIELLPTGLNQVSTKFFTDKTVAQVLSLANAALA
jgi:hypothetical protein